MQRQASNWHGTHVAGSIAAIMNNKRGIVGVAPSAKDPAVRARSACGYDSDIADAMVWAAGTVEPANSNPAKIINLSLGEGTCPATYSQGYCVLV